MLNQDEPTELTPRGLVPWISHIFIHVDYEHLFSNMLSTFQFAYPLYLQYGARNVYFIFIVGGIVSALPLKFHVDQKAMTSNYWQGVFARGINEKDHFLTKWFSKSWNSVARNIGGVASAILTPSRTCGSSGGVSALIGCEFGILLQKLTLWSKMSKRGSHYKHQYRNDKSYLWNLQNKILTPFRKMTLQDIGIILRRLLEVGHILYFISRELNMIYGHDKNFINLPIGDRLKFVLNTMSINHAAHIQGAIFGFCFSLVKYVVS
jgi:membrane associated rhomboid family serine protease